MASVKRTWRSGIEARLAEQDDDDEDESAAQAGPQRSPEVDPYSPDPKLYSAEEIAEFWRRVREAGRECDAAIARMNSAIEAAQRGREARP